MLKNNLELIVQHPVNRGYACRGFKGLRLAAPAYVVFDGATIADQSVAKSLGDTFCQEVLRYAGAIEEMAMPCRDTLPEIRCHALNEPTCRKIFVRPAVTGNLDSTISWPTPSAEAKWLKHWPSVMWEVIPVMPAGTPVALNLPIQWQGINVCFWKGHPIESLWAVMQRAGLAPEESRLFISYVRQDTTPIADQLFEALTQEGFDVFLDRCSVPIGVGFQERLMQDICDKAMVVLLNSAGVTQSHWVEEEIAIVKSYRLGLLELQFPQGKERPDIDPDFRETIAPLDLINAGPSYAPGAHKLSNARLANVVNRIKEIHGRALQRRRYELIDNFAAALAAVGKTAQVLLNGTFLISPTGRNNGVVVGLTARPPELSDFCSLHQNGGVTASREGWLISPSPFFLAHRQIHVSWLGGISNIHHANEAQIAQLVANL